MYKTVLVPNVPWPKFEPLPERKPKKEKTTKEVTDMNFLRWLERQDEKAKPTH